MRMRVAAAVVIATGVTLGTPAWAIQDDGESTTTVEVTEAPTTATDAPTDPPTTATDPPTTTEAPPSTNANPTTTITIPTTSTTSTSATSPTSTGTGATPNTGGQTTPSQRTSSETAALPRDLSETDQTEPPPTEEEEIELVVALLSFYETNTETVVTTTTLPSNKVFVCKYTGTPGIDEALQTGQNPISVAYQPGREPGNYFNDAQGRSYSLAWDIGQDEPDPNECPPPNTGTTTTSSSTTSSSTTTTSTTSSTTSTTSTTLVPTTTTSSTTTTLAPTTTTSSTTTTLLPTTTTSGPTTTFPQGSLLGIDDFAFCDEETNTPQISITFGNRPDLDGDPGLLTFSDGTEYSGNPLVFQSGQTIVFPYPASLTTPLTLTYSIMGETATAVVTLPEDCPPTTTTTTLVGTTTTSTSTTTTTPATTTTSSLPTTSTTTATTTTAPTFAFGAAASVCVAEVPTIRINFLNTFPELAGQTGTLTMSDVNGNVVSTQELVYQPGTTVDLLYPGTSVNADGSINDVPGWVLNDDGFWIRDPSDEFLREGINLTYTVNPTATAFVTYPPESSACANPDGPFPPGPTPPAPPGGALPPTA